MKLSRQWLTRHVDIVDKSDAAIEEALTLIGFEVEGTETTGLPPLEKVVVGEVLKKEPHPNADRLNVCEVNVGAAEPAHIVCGATNYDVGDRVPAALPGAVLPGDFKIKKSKLRGVKSEGMLCSAKELGLGQDAAGLLIIKEAPLPGTPINQVFEGGDTIFDIEVTPNRPDCLSHLGIARELAAYFDRSLDYPQIQCSPNDPFHEQKEPLLTRVEIDAEEQCPLYYAYSIRGVKIGPSPKWLREALEGIGLRPINNVVDVTNFVLHETGQPLHAFDARKIKDGELCIRQARQGEKLTTLDDKTRDLTSRMTVIADGKCPLVIAGVMGSIDAEVDETTSDIVLEAAYFRASFIRWTSRKLGLSTDSSYRFERGVDPHNTEYAACRAIDLILETAGGELAGRPLVVGDLPEIGNEIILYPQVVRELCGFGPDDKTIRQTLERLDLGLQEMDPDDAGPRFRVEIPSWRRDLTRPVDLVEEFLRIYGTDKIPATAVRAAGVHAEDSPTAQFTRAATDYLSRRGLQEALVYTLRAEDELRRWFGHTQAGNLGVNNPLAADQSHLRPSLVPGLLDSLQLNRHRRTGASRFFETGRVFRERDGEIHELLGVGFVIYNDPDARMWRAEGEADFYTAKRICQDLLKLANVEALDGHFRPLAEETPWQPGHAARVGEFLDKGYEAKCGILNVKLTRHWDLPGSVVAGHLLFAPASLAGAQKAPRAETISQFPAATRDLALLVEASSLAADVAADLENAAKKQVSGRDFELESVEVFDVYTGEGVPEGKKSLAFALTFRSPERTLKDKEVNEVFAAIQKESTASGHYQLRA